MPKRKRKVLMGSHAPIKLPEFDWELIEKAYGHPLDHPVRRKIEEVTMEFIAGAIFELTVAPIADARKEVKGILSAAQLLLDALSKSSETIDGAAYARHLLMNHIRDPALPDPTVMPYRDPIRGLSHILTSCVTACHRSLEELDDPDYSVEEGEAWERWINRLTTVLMDAVLPVAARKDEASPSDFVSLVRDLLLRELQDSLPLQYPRHTHSDQALALAISRARVGKA